MKQTLFIKAALAALILTACSSEESLNSDTSGRKFKAKENGLSELQRLANERLTQRYRFFAEGDKPVSIQTESGVQIVVNPANLRVNGQPVHGVVNIEYKEVLNVGGMVTANKTTLGLPEGQISDNPLEQDMRQLISGGEFYVNMTTQEGQNLDEGSAYTLKVPVELTGNEQTEDGGMIAWTAETADTNGDGAPDPEGDVKWEKDDSQDGENDVPIDSDGNYVLDLLSWGWCNIDRLYDAPGPKTTVHVQVPAAYNNGNSKCYIAYTYITNSIAPMDTFDTATNSFGEHWGQMVIGMQCHVIFVSELGGQWLYAAKPVTITPSGLITINNSDLSTATDAALINALNNL